MDGNLSAGIHVNIIKSTLTNMLEYFIMIISKNELVIIMVIEHNAYIPKAVRQAFDMVKRVYPNVTQVEYDDNGNWLYSDGKSFFPSFNNINIDVGVLEHAADAAYNVGIPVTFKI
ncbi:hypothetical protein GAP32_027 [Cronobacter phage vB_CsaM_GAP32]|uniref:Uncharacterized protein n=1 Tax=Cronobacter phage vB_CsaM_GAP32 TaxID=1141136 RepID=K4F9E2_9CAUD|nr:hypothetical protein GAP32_027 [Cronobacter phage vB_CsaM_GAP32]AFC21475.1 hypothetical protein GAP32_027 [Cronobacter phage vB_CsaM_GAP32]